MRTDYSLEASLERHGQLYPIVESQYGIVDGVHRKAKIKGEAEIKKIEVKDKIQHYVLKLHLNEPDKTPEEIEAFKREGINEIANELILRDSSLDKRHRELNRRIAQEVDMSERTVRKYLSERFKRKPRGSSSLGEGFPKVIQVVGCNHCGWIYNLVREKKGKKSTLYLAELDPMKSYPNLDLKKEQKKWLRDKRTEIGSSTENPSIGLKIMDIEEEEARAEKEKT